MSKKAEEIVREDKVGPEKRRPRSAAIAADGFGTSSNIYRLLGGVIEDVLGGDITHAVGGVVVRSVAQMLRLVELERRYGTTSGNGSKTLTMIRDQDPPQATTQKEEMKQRYADRRAELEQEEKEAMAQFA